MTRSLVALAAEAASCPFIVRVARDGSGRFYITDTSIPPGSAAQCHFGSYDAATCRRIYKHLRQAWITGGRDL